MADCQARSATSGVSSSLHAGGATYSIDRQPRWAVAPTTRTHVNSQPKKHDHSGILAKSSV